MGNKPSSQAQFERAPPGWHPGMNMPYSASTMDINGHHEAFNRAMNQQQFQPGSHGKSTSSNSPNEGNAKGSRPDTTDSGYFTGLDSDPKTRAKLRGSRLSLNEQLFEHSNGPMPGFFPNGGPAPPPFGGPPGYGQPSMMHPPQPHFDLLFGPPPPDVDPKKWKKWQKKQLKLIKKGSLPRHDLPMMPPPPGMMGPPPMFMNGGAFRAQSMDNLMEGGVHPMPLPPHYMAGGPRQFGSQMDINGAAMPQMHPNGYLMTVDNRREAGLTSDRASSSGKGSRRSRSDLQPTHFEEERILTPEHSQQTPIIRTVTSVGQVARHNAYDNGIYETLKQRQHTSTVVAQVEVAANEAKMRHERELSQDLLDEQDRTVVSPEAQAILDHNARMFPPTNTDNVEHETKQAQLDISIEKSPSKTADSPEKLVQRSVIPQAPPVPSDNVERAPINQVLRPAVSQQAPERPGSFEPLDAWNSIPMDEDHPVRHKQPLPAAVEEHIEVRLRDSRSADSPCSSEPIYIGYDTQLPAFKKQLIESGNFEMHRQNGVAPASAKVTTESEIAGARFAQNDLMLSRSASKIKTGHGDMSDIDFSWVNDVESRIKACPSQLNGAAGERSTRSLRRTPLPEQTDAGAVHSENNNNHEMRQQSADATSQQVTNGKRNVK